MESIWNGVRVADPSKALKGKISRDIVVVGGGIAGILTAYRLSEQGKNVTLIEANTLYSGVTHNTTAHITALQCAIYAPLQKKDRERSALYYQSQQWAIDAFESLVQKYQIDCDFVVQDGYMYTNDSPEQLKKEFVALLDAGAPAEYFDENQSLGFFVKGMIKLPNQPVFHPIKFLEGLPKNFEIIENTRIIDADLKNKILYAKDAEIRANKIVIATGFPIVNIPGCYFSKMYKSTSYVVAMENGRQLDANYQSDLENGLTYRNHKDYLIICGLDHRTGRVNSNDKFVRLEEIAHAFSPDSKVTHRWSANDCITFDGVPFAGQLAKKKDDIYVITGFNKIGMANSMVSSQIICDLICGVENKFAKTFDPHRKNTDILRTLKLGMSFAKHAILMPLIPAYKDEKQLNLGSGDIIFYNGKKQAVFKDIYNNIYAIDPLCPHMNCELKFNANTKSWDCPCHGSRFDIYGNIIVSPTVNNAKCDRCQQ